MDDAGNLVAGERRLKACQLLGWEEIDTRSLGELSESERQEIELEENVRRKDLTAYERSKTIVALAGIAARQAADVRNWPVVHSQEEEERLRADSARNPSGRGRPKEPGSYRDLEERTGIPEATIRAAEQHVAAVAAHPDLADKPQSVAIAEAKKREGEPMPRIINQTINVQVEGFRPTIRSDLLAALVDEAVRLSVKARHQRWGWKTDIQADIREKAQDLGVDPDEAWANLAPLWPAINEIAHHTKHRQQVKATVRYEWGQNA